jgi:hypothetical protein
MDRFFVFIIGFAVALLILKFRIAIKDFMGTVDFAERYLGSTYNLVILIAFLVFLGSLMYAMGTLQGILNVFLFNRGE